MRPHILSAHPQVWKASRGHKGILLGIREAQAADVKHAITRLYAQGMPALLAMYLHADLLLLLLLLRFLYKRRDVLPSGSKLQRQVRASVLVRRSGSGGSSSSDKYMAPTDVCLPLECTGAQLLTRVLQKAG